METLDDESVCDSHLQVSYRAFPSALGGDGAKILTVEIVRNRARAFNLLERAEKGQKGTGTRYLLRRVTGAFKKELLHGHHLAAKSRA